MSWFMVRMEPVSLLPASKSIRPKFSGQRRPPGWIFIDLKSMTSMAVASNPSQSLPRALAATTSQTVHRLVFIRVNAHHHCIVSGLRKSGLRTEVQVRVVEVTGIAIIPWQHHFVSDTYSIYHQHCASFPQHLTTDTMGWFNSAPAGALMASGATPSDDYHTHY